MGRTAAEVVLVGVSHVSAASQQAVRETILREQPGVVAVELDPGRLQALQRGGRPPTIREAGMGGALLFRLLHALQQRLGKQLGVFPGEEMLTAVQVGREQGIPVALIDRDARYLLQGLRSLPLKEKLSLGALTLTGLAGVGRMDLRAPPGEEVVDLALAELKKRLPALYRLLITDRDRHMAAQLRALAHGRKVVAVVGAGHAKGIRALLEQPPGS